MSTVGIIYGSSRPSEVGKNVASWLATVMKTDDVTFDMIDLAEVNLPMFNEAIPPIADKYEHEHTKQWAARVSELDAVIMVAAEYNHGPTPILKNAIDYLYKEWHDKPVAILSYGSAPQSNAREMLVHIMDHIGSRVVEDTVHVSSTRESVTSEGVDESHVTGDPKVVLSKLIALL